jgi:mono/diheme cytochrome c family protein
MFHSPRGRGKYSRMASNPQSHPLIQLFGLTALLTVTVALRMTAQEPAPRTTMNGVYTTAQAGRGEETYMGICVACHPAGTYSTDTFKTTWTGRTVGDLFNLVSTTMPKNDPASLSAQEYSQLVAYILKINDVPAGKADLPTEVEKLKEIRIEMPSARSNKK